MKKRTLVHSLLVGSLFLAQASPLLAVAQEIPAETPVDITDVLAQKGQEEAFETAISEEEMEQKIVESDTATENAPSAAEETEALVETTTEEDVSEESTDEVIVASEETPATTDTEASENKPDKTVKNGIAIDETTFPDGNFRNYIKTVIDTDKNGQLSNDEITGVTSLNLTNKGIQDLTGIKLFVNLTYLSCTYNGLTSIDVSGMQALEDIRYSNNKQLKTLDFRNCPNLEIAHHSTNQETVYISAGMTKFIGCHAIPEHTGNIVIDLDGYYTVLDDGSKEVDLSTVISQELLAVFKENPQPGFDEATNVLTIAPGDASVQYEAGYDNYTNSTYWTFYTNITNVNDVEVKFELNDGLAHNGDAYIDAQMISQGDPATKPEDPIKEGYTFAGWYSDSELTQLWDFTTGVTASMTLYAKWEETIDTPEPVTTYTVTFDSNGGTNVASQSVTANEVAIEPKSPTKTGYTFVGWYADQALTKEWDFNTKITSDQTLYAKWEESLGLTTPSPSTSNTGYLPATGEKQSKTGLVIGVILASGTLVLLWYKRKQVSKR